jgi:flagellar hook-length control protein FliK
MTLALIDTTSNATSNSPNDLGLKNESVTRQDTSEFGKVMLDVMGPRTELMPVFSDSVDLLRANTQNEMQMPVAGQAITENLALLSSFGVAFGSDALKAVHLGPHLNVITSETSMPDEQSLEAFARSQGLDETAVQWLMGTVPAMTPPAAHGQVSADIFCSSQAGLTNLSNVMSPLPQAALTNTLDLQTEATVADSLAGLAGTPMKTGPGLKPDTPGFQSSLNNAALWVMSQTSEKARITSPAAEAVPDAAKVSLQMMPPPPPAAIWMLRQGLAAAPTKENLTTKSGVALSELDLSDAASPELLESLSASMAEGGASSPTPGAAPTPLSGHGTHRSDLTAMARQETQNSDTNASGPDAILAQRSENIQNLAEKMGQAVGQRILSEIEKGQWHLKLSLRPATLGHIEVEMRMRSGELDAVFTAPQAMTRELLQDGMAKLKDTLNQMGMDVASMQVGDGQTRQGGGESTPAKMSKSTNTGANTPESTPTPAASAPRMKMGQDGWDVLV